MFILLLLMSQCVIVTTHVGHIDLAECKGDWSRVDSRRILSDIGLLSYVTTHLQENP